VHVKCRCGQLYIDIYVCVSRLRSVGTQDVAVSGEIVGLCLLRFFNSRLLPNESVMYQKPLPLYSRSVAELILY
jgi:hypothetical protein